MREKYRRAGGLETSRTRCKESSQAVPTKHTSTRTQARTTHPFMGLACLVSPPCFACPVRRVGVPSNSHRKKSSGTFICTAPFCPHRLLCPRLPPSGHTSRTRPHSSITRLDVLQKKITMKFCKFEVLNEIYLQFFLHRWVVDRETNLMILINL